MNAEFIKRITKAVPKDPSLAFNGGDYFFYEDVYKLDDGRSFSLHRTSSEFDYCQVLGKFTQTCSAPLVLESGEAIYVDGEPLYAWVSERLANRGFVSPHIISED